MSCEYGDYNHRCICEKFVTNLHHPLTNFNNKDPCKSCGHRLMDHPEVRKK